ncbi:hypothetical protein GCM10023196_014710 [Actinoallomurus vinaceus]|uniref:Uncharacterized protein n=1 Tax=Actinoallomurus vinaceus TaxID=1080074 RepID=A0ABP8U374_9ACTN
MCRPAAVAYVLEMPVLAVRVPPEYGNGTIDIDMGRRPDLGLAA